MQNFARLLCCAVLMVFSGLSYASALASEADRTRIVSWSDQALSLDYAGLQQILSSSAYSPIVQLLNDEIGLDEPLTIEISERPFEYFDNAENRLYLPLANFYRLYDDLRLKFPQQSDVQQAIFTTSIQYYLMSEGLEALIDKLELSMTGWQAERIDALVTLMLLKNARVEQAYALDAAEEYLLIDRASGSIQAVRFKTEFEADEYRLSKILCLIEAYDAQESMHITNNFCRGEYDRAITFWGDVLAEHLKQNAQLRSWLNLPVDE